MKMWVDPPSGWRYGFPAVWNDEEFSTVQEFLIAYGYPQEEMDSYAEFFHVRFWHYKEENNE